jgi:hypothetical protein
LSRPPVICDNRFRSNSKGSFGDFACCFNPEANKFRFGPAPTHGLATLGPLCANRAPPITCFAGLVLRRSVRFVS